MSNVTQTSARLGQSARVDQSFIYATDGRLIKSVSADGVVTIWCYYPANGGDGPDLKAFAERSWSAELPLLSAPRITEGMALLPQAQFQYSLIAGAPHALNLILYGYPATPLDRSSLIKANVIATLGGVLVGNAELAMTTPSTSLFFRYENTSKPLSLQCQHTVETAPVASRATNGQVVTVATNTVTDTRYWGTQKVELVTTETRETNLLSGVTVRLSSRATQGSNSDVTVSSERRSLYSARVQQQEQSGEQRRLVYDGLGRAIRETTYVDNKAQNDLMARTDARLSDIETVYEDMADGLRLTRTNYAAADVPRERIWQDGLQGVVRIESQRIPGDDLSNDNWCPVQYYDRRVDYLPGGLQRTLDVGVTPNNARDVFWSAVSESEGSVTSDADSVCLSEETLGDVRGIRLIREQSQTNLKNGSVVTRSSEKLPLTAGSYRSRVQTEKTYDLKGRLNQITHTSADNSDSVRQYTITYDELDRPISWTAPDGSIVRHDYADMSNTVTQIKVKASQISREILLGTQTLDQSSQLTSRQVGDRRYKFQYVKGNIVSVEMPDATVLFNEESDDGTFYSWKATDASGITTTLATFIYNPLEQAIEATRQARDSDQQHKVTLSQSSPGGWESVKYSRVSSGLILDASLQSSLLGNEHISRHTNGSQVTAYRDRLDRRNRVRRNNFEYFYCYNAWGERERITVRDLKSGNTLQAKHQFDAFGQETERHYRINGKEVEVYRQEWAGNGQLLSKSLTRDGTLSRTERYGYDNRERLTSWTMDNTTINWPRAPENNNKELRSQTYAYDIINNLIAIDTTYTDGSRRRQEYSYSTSNPTQRTKIVTIETPTSGNPTRSEVSLTYDTNGNLTKDEQGRTMRYTLSGRLQSVYDKTGQLLTRYEYDELDRMVMQWHEPLKQSRVLIYAGAIQTGEVWLDKDGKQIGHQHWDDEAGLVEQFNTAAKLTVFTLRDPQSGMGTEYLWNDDAQEVRLGREASFTPWGESINRATSVLSSQGYNNVRQDPVTGCYHLGNGYRVYNPKLQMFQQPDSWSPFGSGGLNDYAYCSGDPVNMFDPSGHVMLSRWGQEQLISNLDQLIRDLTPQKPPEQDNTGALITTIIWSLVAIITSVAAVLLAIPTGGLSLVAAGILLGAAVVSSGLSIASVVLQNSNPQLSEKLGKAAIIIDLATLIPTIKSAISVGIRLLRWTGSKVGNIFNRVGQTLRQAASNVRSRAIIRGTKMDMAPRSKLDNTNMVRMGGGAIEEGTKHPIKGLNISEDIYKGKLRVTFQAHGNPPPDLESAALMAVNGEHLGPSEFIDLAKSYGVKFEKYDYIRLLMCHSADGKYSFALSVSNTLKKPLKGFMHPVITSKTPETLNSYAEKYSKGTFRGWFKGEKYGIDKTNRVVSEDFEKWRNFTMADPDNNIVYAPVKFNYPA